jgi:hypothetical protein
VLYVWGKGDENTTARFFGLSTGTPMGYPNLIGKSGLITSPPDWDTISLGQRHGVYLTKDSQVVGWGESESGQLGIQAGYYRLMDILNFYYDSTAPRIIRKVLATNRATVMLWGS